LAGSTDCLDVAKFENIDGLCGAIATLLKEITEHLGVLPTKLATKAHQKEKIYLFNTEKLKYLDNQISELIKRRDELSGQI
jgi:cob(I)alamin adenosyltransferase